MNRFQKGEKMTDVKKELEYEKLMKEYHGFLDANMSLDMSRGKPCKAQEQLILPMLDVVNSKTDFDNVVEENVLNYGHGFGIKSAKKLMAEILGLTEDDVIVGGNSSLNLMYDLLSQLFFVPRISKAWKDLEKVKFICPVPGYDRHFAILEHFGIEMLTVPMTPTGLDMALVKELVKDEAVRGMFVVPKYSNPTGVTFSDKTVRGLAQMQTAADDFIILWDNAYSLHDLYDEGENLLDILEECKKAGNPDRVVIFTSTSKITFAAGGICALASSPNNLEYIKKRMNTQIIGHDKINQLRHVLYLKDLEHIKEIMKEHAEILRPKFNLILDKFEKELKDLATWSNPKGGYFISLDLKKASAKRVFELCKNAGLKLTNVGATFPYGKDPEDKNIRIAPSYPGLEELGLATDLLVLAIKIASVEKER